MTQAKEEPTLLAGPRLGLMYHTSWQSRNSFQIMIHHLALILLARSKHQETYFLACQRFLPPHQVVMF